MKKQYLYIKKNYCITREELYTNTGRVPEIAFLNGERALKLYGQPSIVMIYKRKIVI